MTKSKPLTLGQTMFRSLSPEEEVEYKLWARAFYTPGNEIPAIWHPIVRAECEEMNAEVMTTTRVITIKYRWSKNFKRTDEDTKGELQYMLDHCIKNMLENGETEKVYFECMNGSRYEALVLIETTEK